MPESLLRNVQCRNAVPRERVYRLRDGGGLFLQIKPNGLKYWQFRYLKPDGREGLIQIGPYPHVSLDAARAARVEHRANVRRGLDPAVLRKQERSQHNVKKASVMTFRECARAVIEAKSAEWTNAKHGRQWGDSLTTYAHPIIGSMCPAEIDTDAVMRVLAPIWLDKNVTAMRVRGRIENILDWAKVRGLRDGENPARWSGHLDQLLASPSKMRRGNHHAALPYERIGAFVRDLRAIDSIAARALELTILTAMRTGEVRGMRPAELDLEAGVWSVPPSRMKARRVHRVPLCGAARTLLRALPMFSGEGYVFEGVRAGRPLSETAMWKLLPVLGYGELTVHGFRSTFRDWAAECTPFPNEVVEMALAHTIRDKTESAYRRGDLFEKRRALMQAWERYIEQGATTQ